MELQPVIPPLHVRFTLPGEEYEINTATLGMQALRALEVMGHIKIRELLEGLENPNSTAMTALVWWGRYLTGKQQDISTVDFCMADLKVQQVDGEPVDPTPSETPSELSDASTSLSSLTSSASDLATSTL